MSNPIVVLGGGISGLSCAYYLHKWIGHVMGHRKIIVVESSKHLGGWIMTKTFDDGVIHEIGPKSIRADDSARAFATLCLTEEIGLANDVIGVPFNAPPAMRRLLVANGTIHELPTKPADLFKKIPYLNKRLFRYVLKDFQTPKVDLNKWNGDISVHDFVTHRMGEEIANYYFSLLCKGIVAGDSKKLSFVSLFPSIFEGEQSSGSLLKGMTVEHTDQNRFLNSELAMFAREKRWRLWSLNKGLQTLPDRLCEYLLNIENSPIEIYNESKVTQIDFNSESKTATIKIVNNESEEIIIESDHVFSSIPAIKLSQILNSSAYSKLSKTLNYISSVHVAVVNLEYKGKLLPADAGFGFLIPQCEGSKILGITYDSCVFPNFDAEKDITRITVMMGGEWFEDYFGNIDTASESEILSVAIQETRKYLHFKDEPIRYIVSLHKNCIPQYYVGHGKLLKKINDEIVEKNLNLSLIGASYKGVSVNDCIYNAKLAAESFAKSIGVL